MKMKFVLIIFVTLITECVFGQDTKTFVKKIVCSENAPFNGNRLSITYKEKDSTLKELGFMSEIELAEKEKLRLIGQLLSFTSDKSLNCRKVTSYVFGSEGCRGFPDTVTSYSITIEALFLINRLCWPKSMEAYSCSPVLYDTLEKRVINNEPKAISCFVKEYKKWYKECKKLGRVPKEFPFNTGRYVWFGGRKYVRPENNPDLFN